MDKKTTTIIYNNTFSNFNYLNINSKINWVENKLNIWINNTQENIILNEINVLNKKESIIQSHLKKGIHNIKLSPAFCDKKIIKIENKNEIIEHIILDTQLGFNKWVLNLENNILLEPENNWKYKSVIAIWNDNALWGNLDKHLEFLSSINEIEWLISKDRISDIEDLSLYLEQFNVHNKFSIIK